MFLKQNGNTFGVFACVRNTPLWQLLVSSLTVAVVSRQKNQKNRLSENCKTEIKIKWNNKEKLNKKKTEKQVVRKL